MNSLLDITIKLFILVIVSNMLEHFFLENKYHKYIKSIIIVIMVLTLFAEIKKLNIQYDVEIDQNKYTNISDSVWEAVCNESETVLQNHMIEMCKKFNLNIDKIEVNIETNENNFIVKSISIHGKDCDQAKRIVSEYYNFNSNLIITAED